MIFPLTPTIMAETHPTEIRGTVLGINKIFCVLGEVLAVSFGYLTLDSFEEGNWRLLLLIMSITCLIPTILSFLVLHETPRFFIMNGYYDKGFE